MQKGRGVGYFFNRDSVPSVPCMSDVFLKYFSCLKFPYQDSKALGCHEEFLKRCLLYPIGHLIDS